jgi:hypothetical protein
MFNPNINGCSLDDKLPPRPQLGFPPLLPSRWFPNIGIHDKTMLPCVWFLWGINFVHLNTNSFVLVPQVTKLIPQMKPFGMESVIT